MGAAAWWSTRCDAHQSITTTVIDPGSHGTQTVPDVFPINVDLADYIDSEFYSYDIDNSAINILLPGAYDITLLGIFQKEDDATADQTYICDFNRLIELRAGEVVTIADYSVAIPMSEQPLDGFWSLTSDLWPSGSWSPPDTTPYFTGNLKISYRLNYDPDYFGAYPGTAVQGFYAHDYPGDTPSLWAYLHIIRLTESVSEPEFVP